MQSIYDYPGMDVYRASYIAPIFAPSVREPTYASRDKGPPQSLPEFECTQEQAERIAALPNGLSLLAAIADNPRYQTTRAITTRL